MLGLMWFNLPLSPSGGRKALDQHRLIISPPRVFNRYEAGSGSKTVKQIVL